MKRNKPIKEKYKLYIFRRTGVAGSVIELSLVLKEIKYLMKSMMLNGIKGMMISRQDLPNQISSLLKGIKEKNKQWRKTSKVDS